MKRAALALFFVAASAKAQFTMFGHHATARAGHANGLPASSFVGPWCSGTTPAVGDIIYWSAAGCFADLPVGTNGQILTVSAGLLPSWAAAAGGSAFSAITSGTNTTAAMVVGTGASLATSGSGTIVATGTTNNAVTNAMLAQGAAHTVVGVTGNATANRGDITPLTTYQGAPPQVLGYNGSTATAFQRMPWDTTQAEILNNSFGQVNTTDGATVINGWNITAVGTSAGWLHNKNTATDANHLNFMELTTGTTTTGGANVGLGATGAGIGFLITGGEVVDWLIDIPVASGATNTFRVSAGFADTSAGTTITNGAHISWDNNTDTHWALTTVKAGTSTGTLNVASTNVASTGWHHLTAYFNDNAHVHFYVDGTELSNSPLTTNLPTTVPVFPFARILASAGCAATSTCVIDVNTIYFYKPVSR